VICINAQIAGFATVMLPVLGIIFGLLLGLVWRR
jgi:hypothetical protein